MLNGILALDLNNGLSKNDKIVWKCKEDMKFFSSITKNNILIMGKNTYFSLPKENRPLKERLNIILTYNPQYYIYNYNYNIKNINNLLFTNNINIYKEILENKERYLELYPFLKKDFEIFIIGGKKIYEIYLPLCSNIYLTIIKKTYDCDLFYNNNLNEELENKKNYKNELIFENNNCKINKYIKL